MKTSLRVLLTVAVLVTQLGFLKNTVMEIVDGFSQRCGHVSRVF